MARIRQTVKQRGDVGQRRRLCRQGSGQCREPLAPFGDSVFQLGHALADAPAKCGRHVVGFEACPPVAGPFWTEERGGEEREQRVAQALLVQVHVRRVVNRNVLRPLVRWLARVVRGVAAVVPPLAKPADPGAMEPSVEVVPLGRRTGDGGWDALAGARVRLGAYLNHVVLLAMDNGRVAQLLGPDPGLGRVGAVVALLGGPAVPGLVAGVLGGAEHFPDARSAPCTARRRRVNRHRGRVAVGLGVEAVSDLEQPDTAT